MGFFKSNYGLIDEFLLPINFYVIIRGLIGRVHNEAT